MFDVNCPILGFVAYSGTGKTTLLKRLIPLLRNSGVRVGMIKHAHHDFDIDTPGKDSYELRKAGAEQTIVASSQRWALMTETPGQDEAQLPDLVTRLDTTKLDLILVEGFKHVAFPRIECYRASLGHDFIHTHDDNIMAIAADTSLDINLDNDQALPILDLNNPQQIAEFIQTEILDHR